MLNYWWVTRPKRKLNSVPEILACCADVSLNSEWQGNLYTHLAFEQALEDAGLKRPGERRDQRGGGGRTYFAWISSLGLVFVQESTGQTKLTLAGEAILNGDSPVEVLKGQILKYQFPSPFSLSPATAKTRVSDRFKIRPFRFLLRLLRESRLDYSLSQEEIARIVATEAEDESNRLYEHIVDRILEYREKGVGALSSDFFTLYAPSTGKVNPDHPYSHLDDLANTIINWLDYAQFIVRDVNTNGKPVIRILPEKIQEVDAILNDDIRMIDRPQESEYFQRKYGLDPKHKKDTRNLTTAKSVTAQMLVEQKVKQVFLSEALKRPICTIDSAVVDAVAEKAGISQHVAEELLLKIYPHGAIGAFMTEYFNMAFRGRDEASDFEKATVEIFRDSFGFQSYHVGPIGLSPDVLILSDAEGYQAIIDNKAYSKYTISNDHHNRMVYNYIGGIGHYSGSAFPLAFFSYIAGGFGTGIDAQLKKITAETGIPGSAVCVSNIIKLVEKNQTTPYSHVQIRDIFSLNRQIQMSDF